jgi:very-short-patch-repair endonuclease
VISRALKRAGIPAIPQYRINAKGKKYRLDFAVLCNKGGVAVECDNLKAHSGKLQRRKDKAKDEFLKRYGWTVVRLKELAIKSSVKNCVERVRRAALRRGGTPRTPPLFTRLLRRSLSENRI